jgi:hypothetical protein
MMVQGHERLELHPVTGALGVQRETFEHWPFLAALVARIRQGADAYLATGDLSHLVANELAWNELEDLGLARAVRRFFRSAPMADIDRVTA